MSSGGGVISQQHTQRVADGRVSPILPQAPSPVPPQCHQQCRVPQGSHHRRLVQLGTKSAICHQLHLRRMKRRRSLKTGNYWVRTVYACPSEAAPRVRPSLLSLLHYVLSSLADRTHRRTRSLLHLEERQCNDRWGNPMCVNLTHLRLLARVRPSPDNQMSLNDLVIHTVRLTTKK